MTTNIDSNLGNNGNAVSYNPADLDANNDGHVTIAEQRDAGILNPSSEYSLDSASARTDSFGNIQSENPNAGDLLAQHGYSDDNLMGLIQQNMTGLDDIKDKVEQLIASGNVKAALMVMMQEIKQGLLGEIQGLQQELQSGGGIAELFVLQQNFNNADKAENIVQQMEKTDQKTATAEVQSITG
ncbi:MAG: hypothetical protein AAF899_11695 [Pseudomonadota bacterium]